MTDRNPEMDELGGRFWLTLFGGCLLALVLGLALFFLLGRVWYAWGFLGGFIVLAAGLLIFGWLYDRREARSRRV